MGKYFENGFDVAPSIDKRDQNIDNLNNHSKPGETLAEKEARLKEERERFKE
jgi:hypothetical protein